MAPGRCCSLQALGVSLLLEPAHGGCLLREPGLSPAAPVVHPLQEVNLVGQSPEQALEVAPLAQGRHRWAAGLSFLSSPWRARTLCKGFGVIYLFASIL